MKKTLFALAVVSLVAACVLRFALIGYNFLGLLFFALAAFFAFLALAHGAKSRILKALRVVAVSLAIVGIVCAAALSAVVMSESRGDSPREIDYIIVLGAGLNGDTPSLTLHERLTAAVDMLKRFPEAVAVVSGGMGEGETITEAEAMHRYLTAHGIGEERIITEPKAENTMENLRFSLALIRARPNGNAASVAILSSEYHLYRAQAMARSLGLSPVMLPARTALPVLRLNYILREAVAVAYNTIKAAL